MAVIPGSIRATGFFAPSDSTDTYAVTDSIYGRGSWREVANTTERDAITTDRRRAGMAVYVQDIDTIYILKNGITNLNWTELTNSGTITVDHGGTGLTAVVSGRVLFGDSSTALSTSANFSWNDADQQLSLPQLVLTSKTLADITAGSLEYDGSNLYFSPNSLERYPVLLNKLVSNPYTPTNYSALRTLDAQDLTLDDVANVLSTIIEDLQTLGLFS